MDRVDDRLHVFFLPFLASGHLIPMADLARLFAERGVKATVVTTTANAPTIRASVDRSNAVLSGAGLPPIDLLSVRFPSAEVGLPEGMENCKFLPSATITKEFLAAVDLLRDQVEPLVDQLRPDAIVADALFWWSSHLGVPRFSFDGSSCFVTLIAGAFFDKIKGADDDELYSGELEVFDLEVPGLPFRIKINRTMIPSMAFDREQGKKLASGFAGANFFGNVVNSFYELESNSVDILRAAGMKLWLLGPASLCNRDELDMASRGAMGPDDGEGCLRWLDGIEEPRSAIYVSFGSQGRMTTAQLTEIAAGLEASGRPFVWAVKDDRDEGDWLPEGFRERVGRKGIVARGWVQQLLILRHPSVGGFLTHCGWNSCLEGVTSGLPMIAWPLFGDQAINSRLVVDVLRVGVDVGVEACGDTAEERSLVGREAVWRAVEELMGEGEEAEGRRKRARELAVAAEAAVRRGGGSSAGDVDGVIGKMMELKTNKSNTLPY